MPPSDVVALIERVRRQAPGSALDRVEAALALGQALASAADELIGHFVDEARRDGRSWTEIGGRMGVSKQAARQRFASGLHAARRRRGRRERHGKTDDLVCSFCGKRRDEGRRLIAGPAVRICEECVWLCDDILSGSAGR